MVLENTPYDDIFITMQQEKPKVDFFLKKEEKRFLKDTVKMMMPPFMRISYYTVPESRNTYLCWHSAFNQMEIQRLAFQSGSLLCVNGEKSGRMLYELKSFRKTQKGTVLHCISENLFCYTPHFLSRYREREWHGGKQLSSDELIVTYLIRNGSFMGHLDVSKLNIRHQEYADNSAWQVTDGVVFARFRECKTTAGECYNLIKLNTYIAKSILTESQKEATLKNENIVKMLSHYIQQL